MKRFDGKVVVITGASYGIGRQATVDFANEGAKVVPVARSKDKLDELTSSLGSQAMAYQCDVSSKDDVVKMGKDILEKLGRVDILVNNAGFGIFGTVQSQSIEEIESVMATNYNGMIYCTKVFLDSMLRSRSGHIVNVASVAGSFGIPGMAAYCASKFAMLGFSEALYHELHGTGVGVTVVSPITVKTHFFNNKSFEGIDTNYTGFALSPKTVSRAILAAANSPRLEIIVPFYMRGGVWLKQTFPYLVNPAVGAAFRQKLK